MKTQSEFTSSITDRLITNKFGYGKSFDHAINSWIEGLAADYPGKIRMSDDMVKGSLAFSYLEKAERLLKQKSPCPDDDLRIIDELKSLIHIVEYHKIFLKTLRIAISTCRAGIIPGLAEQGENFSETQRKRLPEKRTIKGITPQMREERDQKILEHFKKTHLTQSHFAQKYAQKYGIKPRTVRKVLSKTVGI